MQPYISVQYDVKRIQRIKRNIPNQLKRNWTPSSISETQFKLGTKYLILLHNRIMAWITISQTLDSG